MTAKMIGNTTESNRVQARRASATSWGSWRWLTLGLPLAAVLAVSTARADAPTATDGGASTNGAHEGHRWGHGRGAGHGPGMMGGMGGMAGMRMHHLLGLAGATDAQKAQIKQIFEGTRPHMQALRGDHMKVHQQLAQALTAATVDPSAVERLRLEQVRLRDQESKLMTQALIKASQVLTPEQRQKIASEIGKHAATK
jgi:protein CpxP